MKKPASAIDLPKPILSAILWKTFLDVPIGNSKANIIHRIMLYGEDGLSKMNSMALTNFYRCMTEVMFNEIVEDVLRELQTQVQQIVELKANHS